MPALVMKQVSAVIDERTTLVCLEAAGQTRPVDVPFSTINGDYDAPPFHQGCRSISVPYLVGQTSDQRAEAAAELGRRPAKERSARTAKIPPRPKPRKRLTTKNRPSVGRTGVRRVPVKSKQSRRRKK